MPVSTDANFGNLIWLDIVVSNKLEHHRHGRMRQRSGWMRLDRNAGIGKGPRVADLAKNRIVIIAAGCGAVEASGGLEHVAGGRKTATDEVDRNDATLGGTAWVERLGHRPEIFSEAS